MQPRAGPGATYGRAAARSVVGIGESAEGGRPLLEGDARELVPRGVAVGGLDAVGQGDGSTAIRRCRPARRRAGPSGSRGARRCRRPGAGSRWGPDFIVLGSAPCQPRPSHFSILQ